MVHVHEIAEEGGANVPDGQVKLTFAKSDYVLGGYI